MDKYTQFGSERLRFSGIGEEDAEILVRWRSSPELIRHFVNIKPVTLEGHLAWFRQQYWTDKSRYDFLIRDKATGAAIGTVGIKDWVKTCCEISYMIAEPAYQRKGLAREAIGAMMDTMKGEGVTRFVAVIHPDNAPSIRTVEGLGYTLEAEGNGFLHYVWKVDE